MHHCLSNVGYRPQRGGQDRVGRLPYYHVLVTFRIFSFARCNLGRAIRLKQTITERGCLVGHRWLSAADRDTFHAIVISGSAWK